MTCTVKVANGAIPLPPGLELPDGAEVQLIVPDSVAQPSFAERDAAYIGAADEQSPTLLDALKEFDGMADDLPADLSANLDHYVHGHGRKLSAGFQSR